MARARGGRTLLAGAFETVEKTPPSSGYVLLPNRSNNLGVQNDLLDDDIVGDRDPGDADLDVPNADGTIKVPLDLNAIGFWLKALLGDPQSSVVDSVYTHVFQSGSWALPTMALERQMPDAASFEMFVGCKANRLRYALQRGGRVNASVEVMAQGAQAPAPATAAGTPASFDLQRFMQAQGQVTVDGSGPGDIVECSIDYTNNLDAVDSVTADGFIGGLDEMRAALTGNLRLRFSSETLFATAKANTPVALSLVHTISASAKLTLAMPRVFLSVPKKPIEGPQGVEASFSWQAARADNGDPMLTATLINAVENYE